MHGGLISSQLLRRSSCSMWSKICPVLASRRVEERILDKGGWGIGTGGAGGEIDRVELLENKENGDVFLLEVVKTVGLI